MKREMVLLAAECANGLYCPLSLPKDALIVHWQGGRNATDGHIALEDALDELLLDIRAEHMRWAYETGMADAGGKSLQEELKAGADLSMWWLSLLYERHPKLSPNLFIIYKLRCLELLLRRYPCVALRVYGGDEILRNVLAGLCNAAGIEFSCHMNPAAPENEAVSGLAARIYGKISAPARALLRFVHWWWTIRRHLPFVGKKWQNFGQAFQNGKTEPGTATIATYFPNIDMRAAAEGRFRSRYWEDLHDALNSQARLEKPDGPHFARWLFIRFPSPQISFAQCRELRDVFARKGKDGLTYNYLEEFLSAADCFSAIRRWLALCFKSMAIQKRFADLCHFKNSGLNFWPYVREQWAESFRGWRCLERCLQFLAFARYYKMAGKQRWSLFPLENCPWERMLTVAAHSGDKGPVYGAQHSTVRPVDFRYFDDPRTFSTEACNFFQPDLIAGNGSSACSQWLANGLPQERLTRIEALRYLYLVKNHARTDNPHGHGSQPVKQEKTSRALYSRKILVLTGFFQDETQAHLNLLKASMDEGLLDDWKIVIKPHPYLSVRAWLQALPKEQMERIRIAEGAIASELRPGMKAWASNSTTAALEAAIMGLPVMVMRPVNDFDLCPIQNVSGLIRTGKVADVAYGLAHLKPLELAPDYLELEPGLNAWRRLLGLAE